MSIITEVTQLAISNYAHLAAKVLNIRYSLRYSLYFISYIEISKSYVDFVYNYPTPKD